MSLLFLRNILGYNEKFEKKNIIHWFFALITKLDLQYWDQKISGNSGMVHFGEINQAPLPYSMLQYSGRVATPKPAPRNCLRYLQTTLILGGGGLVSEFMWAIVVGSQEPTFLQGLG